MSGEIDRGVCPICGRGVKVALNHLVQSVLDEDEERRHLYVLEEHLDQEGQACSGSGCIPVRTYNQRQELQDLDLMDAWGQGDSWDDDDLGFADFDTGEPGIDFSTGEYLSDTVQSGL